MKKWIFLISIILFPISSGVISDVESQVTNLKVTAHPTTLNAGFNTTVLINIFNDFESIYDIDISLRFPQSQISTISPIAIGPSNWKFEKIRREENVTIDPLIFVPKDAAGNGYLGNIVISYKRLGYISPQSETHVIGFYAKGQIEVILYELSIEPESATAGSVISITASLLNKGTVTAKFMNVSLFPGSILVLKPESYNYIGDLEPNSPAPFTLEALLNSEIYEGEYSIKLIIEYEDEEAKEYVIESNVSIYVIEMVEEQYTPAIHEKIIETITGELLYIIIIIIVVVIAIAIVIKLRSSKSEFETEEFQT